jgi:hypothetical protein
MAKMRIDSNVSINPMPVVLAGAVVGGRQTSGYRLIARELPLHGGGVARRCHHERDPRAQGVQRELPGLDLLEKTDYCGLSRVGKNKSQIFTLFHGD